MNVYDAKHITIPEGAVARILDSSNNTLWGDAEYYGQFHLTNEDVNTVTISIVKNNSNAPTISLQYKYDGGTSWTTLGNTSTTALTITIPVGKVLYLRSTSERVWGWQLNGVNCYNYFSSDGLFGAHGNITTLLGYEWMQGYDCYRMFYNCDKLVSLPFLSVKRVASYSYYEMFRGTGVKDLSSYKLPATQLAEECYGGMFSYCGSLLKGPILSATTAAKSCYHLMFASCTSLVDVHDLPITVLTDGCYQGMFRNCTALTKSPYIRAIKIEYASPQAFAPALLEMFINCTSLNSIQCNIENPNASSFSDWVENVAPSGTFYKNPLATWSTGKSGVPTNWTVRDL